MKRPPGNEMLWRARRLRRDMTDAERLLWSRLRASQLGAKFRRQMWLLGFVADFASVEATLVIEVDGGQHDRERARDERRERAMSGLGYRTLRFWNNDVLENLDGVVAIIQDAVPSPSHPAGAGRAPPSPQDGRGVGVSE